MRETTHDVTFLHNEQFFAAAQKKYTYIYDKRGLEVHCLKVRTPPGAVSQPLGLCCLPMAVGWCWLQLGLTAGQCLLCGATGCGLAMRQVNCSCST